MLIINADDFGKDSLTNKAIVRSFERGLCSSATIMPNMPGFEEACQLAHDHKLINSIGVHLVLHGSYPLTEKIRHLTKLCDNTGQLCLGRLSALGRSFLMLGTSEKASLAQEIRAQIRRCRAHKIPVICLDSHSHIHTVWVIASIIMRIAKEEGIHFIRIARNLGPDSNAFKTIYKNIFNKRLKKGNFARTDYFGAIDDLFFLKKRNDISGILQSCEIMVHPRFNEHHILLDDLNGLELEKLVSQIYSGLGYSGSQ